MHRAGGSTRKLGYLTDSARRRMQSNSGRTDLDFEPGEVARRTMFRGRAATPVHERNYGGRGWLVGSRRRRWRRGATKCEDDKGRGTDLRRNQSANK
jgi:hypothetical protein